MNGQRLSPIIDPLEHLRRRHLLLIRLNEDGYAFTSKVSGDPVTHKADNSNYKYATATHGHMPEKGPKPAFILSGPGVKKDARLTGCSIVDEAPTLARLLGFETKHADGKVLHEVLED